MKRNRVLIALGANVDGAWGTPEETLKQCLNVLRLQGFSAIRMSPLYLTKAHGAVRQPPYFNTVLEAACVTTPRQALELFKQNERRSGRRLVGRNGPRPLDIDLLDFAGRIVNWRAGHPRPKLVLPHPLLAERAFVLVPLVDLAPDWRHPVSGLTAHQLLIRQGGRRRFILRREIFQVDHSLLPCDSNIRACSAPFHCDN
jgi:2-amino-4-hydroxy-6-hydroxymethyldihydropteridine diphosphokinase